MPMPGHPVGWRREPARHSLAARGITTGRKTRFGTHIKPRHIEPFWSGKYRDVVDERGIKWGQVPDLTHEEMLEFIERLKPLLEEAGIHPVSGDCSAFAIALRWVLGYGGTDYVACYVDDEDYEHGVALHVAIKYNGRMYDAAGETNEITMLQHVIDWDDVAEKPQVITEGLSEYDILYEQHDEVDKDNIVGGDDSTANQERIQRIMEKVLKDGAQR